MSLKRGFASDNNAGVHPRVLEALRAANGGHVAAYGDDPFTERARDLIAGQFGGTAEVFFVFGGTGANVLALQAMARPHHAVVCAETAHVYVDECGAPERFAGCKLLPVRTPDGKLRPADIEPLLGRAGDQHHVQPRVVSVSQPTELGTVYRPGELEALSAFAGERGLLIHLDGARLANAAAHLGVSLAEAARGADAVSFGGTKNGMMYGEAVVFTRAELAKDFAFVRKQGAQLASKMRFIAAQFAALLTDGLWLETAAHANRMARLLAAGLHEIPQVRLTRPVESNAVFACLPPEHVAAVQREFFFYVWNEAVSEVRLMCSFDTTEGDVRRLASVIKEATGDG